MILYTVVHILFLTIGTFSQNAMMKRVKGFAPHLIAAGHRITIVAQDTAENRDYFSSVGAETVFFSGSGLLSEIQQKTRLLQQHVPDVVYACGWGLRNLPALLGSTAIVEHAELLSANPESSALNCQKNFLLEWISVLFADGLVLASSYLLRTYQRRDVLGHTKQLRLPYGLNLKDDPVVQSRESEGSTSRVLYMGSLYASYGILDIVDAASHVVEAEEAVEFIILGDGPDRQKAIEQARSLGIEDDIRFEGYVHEEVLDEYLGSADVFLSPMFDTVKDKARCPSKIPMYMRYRKPIVTCRIGEISAYLGDHGFCYSPGEPESMATQVLRASRVQNPVEYDLQSVCWQHLSERFLTWLEKDVLSGRSTVEDKA